MHGVWLAQKRLQPLKIFSDGQESEEKVAAVSKAPVKPVLTPQGECVSCLSPYF